MLFALLVSTLPPPPLAAAAAVFHNPAINFLPRSYEEYVPLKKRRQMEEAERLARLGRAPAPTSSADTGGGRSGGGTDSEAEVDHRQKESLLVLKAKQLQEVRGLVLWVALRGAGRPPGESIDVSGCVMLVCLGLQTCCQPWLLRGRARLVYQASYMLPRTPAPVAADAAGDGAGASAEGGAGHYAAGHSEAGAQDVQGAGQGGQGSFELAGNQYGGNGRIGSTSRSWPRWGRLLERCMWLLASY